MSIKSEVRTYRLTGITPMLGSNPREPEDSQRICSGKG